MKLKDSVPILVLGTPELKKIRTTNRGEFFLILYKIICIISFAFFYDLEYLWLLTFILVIGSAYNYYLYKTERPYYSNDLAVLYNVTSAAYLFVNLVLLLCMLLHKTEFEGGVQLLFLCTPIVAIAEYFSRHPKYSWTSLEFKALENAKDCTKYLRYITHIVVDTSEADYNIALDGFIMKHMDSCKSSYCYLRESKMDAKEGSGMKLSLYYYLRELYKDALKRFPNYPALRISYAFFLLEIMEDPVRAQKQLKKAQRSNPRLDEDFVIFRYCRIIQEKLTEYKHKGEIGMDRVSLVVYDNYFRQCKSSMKRAAKLHAEFWSNLNVQMPDLEELIKISAEINQVILDIEEYWGLMKNMNANMSNAIRQYARFLREILNDEDGEKEMIKNIKQDQRRAEKDTDSVAGIVNHYIKSWSNDGAPYLLISGQKRHLGTIKAINKSALRIFGYSSNQLIGEHMDMLLPSILRNHHRKTMKECTNNPETLTLLNKEKLVPCLLSNGYILMATKIIRTLPSFRNDMNYVVSFKLDKNLQMENVCYLIINKCGIVKSISESNFL